MVIALVYFVASTGAAVAYGRALDRQLEAPRLRAAWAEGLTAEARCTRLRTEEIQDVEGVPIVQTHPTLEFRTADGRTVAFEERQARLSLAEGDLQTVYYSARNPEDATTRAPSFGLRHVKVLVAAVGGVVAAVTATALAAFL
ncbi:DUF3592 domain-containing protein [Streptomyces sp. NPDC014734]|uniref:DUF3592 domain-containing protein n=1 Tax=Streptomyces sp. NPDC014734 TaxID=3364886 RepID=UPI0036FBDA8D